MKGLDQRVLGEGATEKLEGLGAKVSGIDEVEGKTAKSYHGQGGHGSWNSMERE